MIETILQNESTVRLSSFAGILLLMLALEACFPRKSRTQNRGMRWLTNLGMVIVSALLVRIIIPVAAMGVAVFATSKGWGVLNMIDLPIWAGLIIAVLLLDLAIYGQHIAFHKIPLLWNIHQMHHADRDIDATTGVRFHPVEIAISMLYKFLIILLLGPQAIAVLVFEIVLNGSAMFNHANLKLPLWLDKSIRVLLVTPDMHRVHHSVHPQETDSNYGFNLSIWDRVFGTYIAQPRDGHDKMTIGLQQYQTDDPSRLFWCLSLPFKRQKNGKF